MRPSRTLSMTFFLRPAILGTLLLLAQLWHQPLPVNAASIRGGDHHDDLSSQWRRKLPPTCTSGKSIITCQASGGGAKDLPCCPETPNCDGDTCTSSTVVTTQPATTTQAATTTVSTVDCPDGSTCTCQHDADTGCTSHSECDQTITGLKCTQTGRVCTSNSECTGGRDKCNVQTTQTVSGVCEEVPVTTTVTTTVSAHLPYCKKYS